jgi:hypothetical protein
MGTYVDCTIKITKGDPKEVLDVICPKDGVIDLSAVAVSEEQKKFWKSIPAEYSANTAENGTKGSITFWVKNFTPDGIFDDLAERFPQHEFEVQRAPGDPEYPMTVLLFKDGEFQKGFQTMDGKTVCQEIPKRQKGLAVKRYETIVAAEHVNRMLSGRTIQSVEAGTTDGWILLNLAPLPDSNPDIEREFVKVYVGSDRYRERTPDSFEWLADIYLRAEYKTGGGRLMLAPRIHMWDFDKPEDPPEALTGQESTTEVND